MIKKYSNIKAKLDDMRDFGNPCGDNTGFSNLDALYTLKQGSFTFILAAPHHGKSELCFEIAFNQAERFGKKSLIYSPETGSVEDIYAEFIHKFIGKSFYKNQPNSIDEKEYNKALNYIDEFFSIVDSDEKSYTFEDLTKLVTDEKIIVSDPYNELKHDMASFNGRQDLYIEELCGYIRRYCKKNNMHCIQTLHPASQQIVVDTKNNLRYYPMPIAREAAGGQALFRKAMTWINMWRPPAGLSNEHGMPYKENEVLIMIEKAKPKGVAKRGMTSLFFDWKRNRYYQEGGQYAFEHENKTTAIMPSTSFDTITPSEISKLYNDDKSPF